MTVRELIELLQAMPPDAVAVVNLEKNELANGDPVRKVSVKKASQRHASYESYACEYYPELPRDDGDPPVVDVVDVSA